MLLKIIKNLFFQIHSIKGGFLQAFQVFCDKEKVSDSQEKDLIHVKKNTADLWIDSFLKELKNSNDIVSENILKINFYKN
jgi:tryptophan 2,3-dioxygenase